MPGHGGKEAAREATGRGVLGHTKRQVEGVKQGKRGRCQGGGRACTAIGVRGTKTIMIATLENMIRNIKKHITPS